MNPTHSENENSFNLIKENRQRNGRDGDRAIPFTWQEHAYERLKVLYKVSKILTSMDNMGKTFPEILSLCSASFPILTAIVIEGRNKKINSIVWHADNVSQDQINLAVNNAKEFFIYLTNASDKKSNDLRATNILAEKKTEATKKENYCVIPLLVDQLPAFGVLQIEGSLPLNEKDLEFIGALADLIAISVDRQSKTKLEQKLRKKEAQLSSLRLNRSQSHVRDLEIERELRERFVSLLTHDLRTPLTAIKMSAQLLQRRSEDPNVVQMNALRINKNVDRADSMITDLLDANRIRSGEKLPLKIEHVDLSALVKETLDELTIVHGPRFILKADKSIQGYFDPKGIRRIIENLCNNAIKYGSPDTMISVIIEQKANNAIIEVRNKGNIISHEDQKFLFQQFRRGRKTVVKGWGIGLALVRGVAEAHSGTVKVKSETETGTVFTVSIPMDSRSF